MIGDTEYYQSAWIRVAASGKKYFSMSYTPVNASPVTKTDDEDFDDDVPF
jgi:hypothetical protein